MARCTASVLIAVLSLQVAQGLAAEVLAPPAEQLISAWRRQQETVTSAKFLLLGRHSTAIPGEEDKKLESNFKLSFFFMGTNGCSLIESDRAILSADQRELISETTIAAFDGEQQARTLVTREASASPLGIISDPSHGNRELRIAALEPLALAFRAFAEPFMGKTLDEYHSAAANDDSTQQLLAVDIRRLYIDAQAPFAARRYVFGDNDDAPFYRCKITDVKVVDDLWIPMKWTVTFFGGHGEIESQESYKLAVYDLNPQLSIEDFCITFPEGTRVDAEFADRPIRGVVEDGVIRDRRSTRIRLRHK
jgi:hypothetical protein